MFGYPSGDDLPNAQGKSSLSTWLATQFIAKGKTVMYISLESSRKEALPKTMEVRKCKTQ